MTALTILLMLSSLGLLVWLTLKPQQWRNFIERDNARLKTRGVLSEKAALFLSKLESGPVMQFALVVVFLLAGLNLLARLGVLGKWLH